MDTNVVVLSGRLGQDPEVRMTQGGQQVATLNLAVSEVYMVDGKKQEKTYWFKVVCWGNVATVAGNYLAKGGRVQVTGKLVQRSWDGTDGKKNYAVEVVCSNLNIIDFKDSGNKQPNSNNRGNGHSSSINGPASDPNSAYDDDVPFN